MGYHNQRKHTRQDNKRKIRFILTKTHCEKAAPLIPTKLLSLMTTLKNRITAQAKKTTSYTLQNKVKKTKYEIVKKAVSKNPHILLKEEMLITLQRLHFFFISVPAGNEVMH